MHGASHEVLGRLAVGGMAEIYLARTTHQDGRREIVVLKRILPHLSEDPEFVRMFRDEAYLAATLDHPNIVRVHDIGQDGEDYFFTMEYVHGENVRTIIKAAQKVEMDVPLQHVVQIGLGVCDGLHYAHEQLDDDGTPLRIVHRDVSPTNILVSFEGEVKIVDFGIAKAAAATHVTQAGMLKGKASYMSPEQCRAEPVDRRSDVFAIGILLYEMTTLTRLFRGDNELAVLHQILTGAVEAPSTRVDDYPADLEHIVMKALAQRPDDRYPTALDLRHDLERFARVRRLQPSTEALGEYLRDLCGERPPPWYEEDDNLDEDLDEGLDAAESGTGMPTSMGNFEDEEDTQVNRRSPDLRTLIPGAPTDWTRDEAAASEPEETTGTTNRRALPDGSLAPPRGAAKRVGARIEPAPRPGARPGGRLRLPAKGMPRRRPSSTDETMPVPGNDDPLPRATSNEAPYEARDEAADEPPQGEPTTPMIKPDLPALRGDLPALRGARRRPAPRPGAPGAASPDAATRPEGAGSRPVASPFGGVPHLARSGRTLQGATPARSGRTVPGGPASSSTPTDSGAGPSSPGSPALVATSANPLPGGGADRTMTAGAGSRPRAPTASTRPGRRPSASVPIATPIVDPSPPPPSSADRTMALTPEQARAMAQLGASASPPPPGSLRASPAASMPGPNPWSGPGVDRTEIATPLHPPFGSPADAGLAPDAVDERARTVALPRYDRTMLADAMNRPTPRGPMGWGEREDPLTKTQKTTPSVDPMTSTQRSPIMPMGPPPPLPSALYSEMDMGADLRRPEMRSPSPRPESTPRSLWVPVLVVVILGLAGTAVWLWLRMS